MQHLTVRRVRDPWAEFTRLQQEMNRVFSNYQPENDGSASTFPALNVWSDDQSVYVESELPGLKLDDLEIVVTAGNHLSIKGRRVPDADKDAVWHRRERGYGEFSRVVQLPFEVDPDKVQAIFRSGVLRLSLPKHVEAKPRKIQVQAH